ncbi:MAG: MCE family protein [Xanthomonadales bacterium]|nr:MCE family protein [Gammaproteobacteria bacterium]MBT8053964.1 MCE family protein [Gammaproteobacteria bacterium]NND58305.1 MCE family protein [Xanthomonadales bacterium]NNK51984.1 MCE family protein [Xanthomonadales bacterium]
MFKGDRNFAVGLFVSIAIASFVIFVVWLTGRTGTEEMKRYSLLFHKDISGLSVGGPVKYMGMNIGTVVAMQLEQRNGIRIRVDIDILESTPVDHGTFASLALQGITGVAVVNLASDPGDHAPLEKIAGEPYQIIPVRVVGFSALMASAPEIMGKLDHLLTKAGEILGEENQATVAGTLENIEGLTASLAEERETIAEIPGNLNTTITDIQATVLQLQEMISQLQPGIHTTVENINQSSRHLASLTSRVDGLLRDHQSDMSHFMQEGLAEAPALMMETRAALRSLEKLVMELQHDPSQLIYRPAVNSVEIEP